MKRILFNGKSSKTTLLLVRHGESEANKEQIFGGHYDAALTENGSEQARITGRFIGENYKASKVYASDLKRAYVTGSTIAKILGADITDEEKKTILAGKAFEKFIERAGK